MILEPKFIEDKGTTNNTETAVNVGVENRYGGGTYYFSSTQDPKKEQHAITQKVILLLS